MPNGYQNLHYLFNYLFYHDEPAGDSLLFTEPEPSSRIDGHKVGLVQSVRFPDANDDFHVCRTRSYPFRVEVPAAGENATGSADMTALLQTLANAKNSRNKNAKPVPRAQEKKPQQKSLSRQVSETMGRLGYSGFTLTVGYPGLYIGLGYAHGLDDQGGETNNDFKVGFSFDYTTGLPYLPGSSLKGMLRSCFDEKPEDTIAALMEAVQKEVPSEALALISRKIFGNPFQNPEGAPATPEKAQEGSVVFFDAFPCSDGGSPLMHDDYITPQREKPLGDPKPIRTLKVSPGVQFRFIFAIPQKIEVPCAAGTFTLDRSDIGKWFQQLIEDWGIGAKTNSGYGLLFKSPQ